MRCISRYGEYSVKYTGADCHDRMYTGHNTDTVDIAGRLETIAVQSDKNVMVGQQRVEEVVSGTNGMEGESRAVRENMGELHEHTKDMEKIISIINEISSRTSLLSLNASIEAARAVGNRGI